MIDCRAHLWIEGDRRTFAPGEIIAGEYRLDAPQSDQIDAVELSVLWYTEGTGDEDLAVHFFERRGQDANGRIDLRLPRRFSTQLPQSPLSYDGLMLVGKRRLVRGEVMPTHHTAMYALWEAIQNVGI